MTWFGSEAAAALFLASVWLVCNIFAVFAAAEMISTFLKSSNHNLKYVGIDGLARIVRINPKYAAEHQLAVIDCLEDPDDMLKKKTLELLYKMTKPNNVEVSNLTVCNMALLFAMIVETSMVPTGTNCCGFRN